MTISPPTGFEPAFVSVRYEASINPLHYSGYCGSYTGVNNIISPKFASTFCSTFDLITIKIMSAASALYKHQMSAIKIYLFSSYNIHGKDTCTLMRRPYK